MFCDIVFFIFISHETDTQDVSENMDLKPDPTDSNTVKTKFLPSIFIREVNDFSEFCVLFKDLLKGEEFTCESFINNVKLSTISGNFVAKCLVTRKHTTTLFQNVFAVERNTYPSFALSRLIYQQSTSSAIAVI